MFGAVGAVLMTASGALAGDSLAAELIRRENELKELLEILDMNEIYLSSCRLSTREIFDRISFGTSVYARCFRKLGEDITHDAAENLRQSGLAMCERFADNIENFGCTDLDGQLAQNGLIRSDVKREYESACEKRRKYTGIYRAAGLSAGMIAALLLI